MLGSITDRARTLLAVRVVRFGLVGASGVLVNEGMLIFLHGIMRFPLAISSICSVETSIISNFVLNSLWTWKYDFNRSLWLMFKGCVRYHAVTGFSMLTANVLLLVMLVRYFGVDYRIANLIGILVGSIINYLGMHFWVFRKPRRQMRGR